MKDTLEVFVSGLNTNTFKVIGSPSKIFLCGGPFGSPDAPPLSLRQIFHEDLKKHRSKLLPQILLAEKASEWYESARIYDNLLDLEEHIASLSAIIVLFVESAGSIAELGAFSEAEPFRKKLIVVIEESHYSRRSFIRQGPIKLIEAHSETAVRSFPWLHKGPQPTLDLGLCHEAAREIENRLDSDLHEHAIEQTFHPTLPGHRMLLIADLVGLAGAIRESDLNTILGVWKIDTTSDELDKYLFLLENLDIIRKIKYGHTNYLIPANSADEYISYPTRVSGRQYDRLRLQNGLQRALPQDRERQRVYRRAMNKGKDRG